MEASEEESFEKGAKAPFYFEPRGASQRGLSGEGAPPRAYRTWIMGGLRRAEVWILGFEVKWPWFVVRARGSGSR